MARIPFIPFFLLLVLTCNGQSTKWKQGSIIIHGGDTLTGQVLVHSLNFYRIVKFMSATENRIVKYGPGEISGYICDSTLYRSVSVPVEDGEGESLSFAQELATGKMRLYYTRYRKVTCSCDPEGSLVTGYILIKDDAPPLLIEKKPLRKKIKQTSRLAAPFSGDEELYCIIMKGGFRFDSLTGLVKRYNGRNQ